MGKIIIIMGPTGSGKSRSTKDLDPTKTVQIATLRKDLPYKGSRSMYNEANNNLFHVDTHTEVINLIEAIDAAPTITTVIIDDFRYIAEKELFRRAKESGYTKFTDIGMHIQQILLAGEKARPDLTIVLMLHDEDIVSNNIIIGKRVKMAGKMVTDRYDPLEVVDICLYCKPSFEKNSPIHQFYTRKTVEDGIEIPAKTPEGMFETLTIPNDLALVLKTINEYYS